MEEKKITRQAKYDKANTKPIMLKLNLNTDADILEMLDMVPNRQGYIKELIRKDIAEKHVSRYVLVEDFEYDSYNYALKSKIKSAAIDEARSLFEHASASDQEKIKAAYVIDLQDAEDYDDWQDKYGDGFDTIYDFK